MTRYDVTSIVEIEKFLQYNLNKYISNRNKKRTIRGSFKEKGSNKIYRGDEFEAYELSGCSALEVYECYIAYYNYTIQNKFEKARIAVKAEWVEKDEE